MKPEITTDFRDDATIQEVWKLKEENAAAHGFDIDSIAHAARNRQEEHPERIVRKRAIEPISRGTESERATSE